MLFRAESLTLSLPLCLSHFTSHFPASLHRCWIQTHSSQKELFAAKIRICTRDSLIHLFANATQKKASDRWRKEANQRVLLDMVILQHYLRGGLESADPEQDKRRERLMKYLFHLLSAEVVVSSSNILGPVVCSVWLRFSVDQLRNMSRPSA